AVCTESTRDDILRAPVGRAPSPSPPAACSPRSTLPSGVPAGRPRGRPKRRAGGAVARGNEIPVVEPACADPSGRHEGARCSRAGAAGRWLSADRGPPGWGRRTADAGARLVGAEFLAGGVRPRRGVLASVDRRHFPGGEPDRIAVRLVAVPA